MRSRSRDPKMSRRNRDNGPMTMAPRGTDAATHTRLARIDCTGLECVWMAALWDDASFLTRLFGAEQRLRASAVSFARWRLGSGTIWERANAHMQQLNRVHDDSTTVLETLEFEHQTILCAERRWMGDLEETRMPIRMSPVSNLRELFVNASNLLRCMIPDHAVSPNVKSSHFSRAFKTGSQEEAQVIGRCSQGLNDATSGLYMNIPHLNQ
ncbi:hypothetical protein B0H14DRAFT_3781126 [Mycena olivaceomarginata]|nr:hypothetical protein B0H14DRAFT_3781126 [Mycena olivaceomarginata]